MRTLYYFTTVAMLMCATMACSQRTRTTDPNNQQRTLVRFETTKGKFTVALYDETPLHHDNFVKLVENGTYDGVLFHRVIKDFMIQAGDPNSKTATDTAMLGDGDVGYTIPAEIRPEFHHRRGVLAAARQGDDVNPERASSGCQFYIVTGRKFSEAELQGLESEMNNARLHALFDSLAQQHIEKIISMQRNNDSPGLLNLQEQLQHEAEQIYLQQPRQKMSDAQRADYTSIGGAPHLDGAYTIFGEVVEGMDVVALIENEPTGPADRPKKDIRIKKATIVK